MKLYQIFLSLLLFFAYPLQSFSAPDPSEVERLKKEADLFIIGYVQNDTLILEDRDNNTQIREMEIFIQNIESHNLNFPIHHQNIIVQYHYLPSWLDFVGGGTIKIRKGDKVRLSLTQEGNYFKPVLGFYGVEIVEEHGERIEHIPEPITHKINRLFHYGLRKHSSILVFLFMLVTLLLILFGCFRIDCCFCKNFKANFYKNKYK